MLETLFSSRVRSKIISTLFMSPGVEYHALELAQRLGESYSAFWKELVRLLKLGLISQLKEIQVVFSVDQLNWNRIRILEVFCAP